MSSHEAIVAKKNEHARRAMRAAMVTIQNASVAAMAAASTVERQAAVAESTEYAIAAIKGMNHAISKNWMEG